MLNFGRFILIVVLAFAFLVGCAHLGYNYIPFSKYLSSPSACVGKVLIFGGIIGCIIGCCILTAVLLLARRQRPTLIAPFITAEVLALGAFGTHIVTYFCS
jgi:hypothetical protein